jgi:hypothetical protein
MNDLNDFFVLKGDWIYIMKNKGNYKFDGSNINKQYCVKVKEVFYAALFKTCLA